MRFSVNWAVVLRSAAYSVFFIAALLFFIFMRFPSRGVESMILRAAENVGADMDISNADLTFPPGLKIEKISIFNPSTGEGVFSLSSTLIKPLYLPVIKGGLGARMTSKFLGGNVWMSGRTSGGAKDEISVVFKARGVDPGLLETWNSFPWGKLGGKLEGEG